MIRRIKAKDFREIASWYKARKIDPPAWQELSETGWIADDRVAGWLFCTNSSVAIIEGIISNPATVPSLRRESLLKLTGFMVDTALLLGYSSIIAASKHPSIDACAKQLGFRETDLTFYVLNDNEEDSYDYKLSNREEE